MDAGDIPVDRKEKNRLFRKITEVFNRKAGFVHSETVDNLMEFPAYFSTEGDKNIKHRKIS